jgi:4a-hydroxytetrahydrobiopterin dehydratase
MSNASKELTAKHCKPCEGKTDPMADEEAVEMLKKVDDWDYDSEDGSISKLFEFDNFYKTMAFVNAVAWIANREDHHPDLQVTYSSCLVVYTTHAIGGLSDNDFICAAKVDDLLAEDQG